MESIAFDRITRTARMGVELALRLVAPGLCLGCRRPGGDLCALCVGLLLGAASGPEHSVLGDEGPAAALVRAGKDHGAWRAGATMARITVQRIGLRPPYGVTAVTWVPADPVRLRKRGFHLPRMFGQGLAAAWGVPSGPTLTKRATPPQRGSSLAERQANVRGVFAPFESARRLSPRSGATQRLLVVDDVRTSGATLEACYGALRDAGFRHVVPLAFAGHR